jgi:hypothetical protein
VAGGARGTYREIPVEGARVPRRVARLVACIAICRRRDR